jgi:hypothetical protein
MAVFFDVLVVDERSLLHEAYLNRTKVLSKLIRIEPGQVDPYIVVLTFTVNPSESIPSQSSTSRIRHQFTPMRHVTRHHPPRRRIRRKTCKCAVYRSTWLDETQKRPYPRIGG